MLNKWDTEHLPGKCLLSSFPWDHDKGFPSLADDRWRIWKVLISQLGEAVVSSVDFFLFLGTSESRQGFGGFLLNPFLRDYFLLFLWFWPNRTDLPILSCVLSKNRNLCLPATLYFCSDSPGWEGRNEQMKNALLALSDAQVMPENWWSFAIIILMAEVYLQGMLLPLILGCVKGLKTKQKTKTKQNQGKNTLPESISKIRCLPV